jgi:hypothetical protein
MQRYCRLSSAPNGLFKGFIVEPYVGGCEAEYGGNLGSPLRMTTPWPYGSPSHSSCLMACLDSARGGRITQRRGKGFFRMSRRSSLRHVRIQRGRWTNDFEKWRMAVQSPGLHDRRGRVASLEAVANMQIAIAGMLGAWGDRGDPTDRDP